MLQVQIHEKYLEKRPTTGGNPDYDQILSDFRDNLVGLWGISPRANGDYVIAEIPDNIARRKFDLITFLAVMFEDFTKTMTTNTRREGGDVKNWNPFIKLSETAIDFILPEGLPNRMKTVIIDDSDPENIITEEQVKTWREWIETGGNYTYQLIDGYYYFTSVAGNKGFYLSGEELLTIHFNVDSELITELPIF